MELEVDWLLDLRSRIKSEGSFCSGGRLDRKSNNWLREAFLKAEMERVPHDKHVKLVLNALVDRHTL